MNNRIYKFRAWDKKEKRMEPDIPFCMDTWTPTNLSEKITEIQKYYILMQYTGLLDKNGKEIYDGDIVNYDSNNFVNGLNGLIEWVGSGFYLAKHIPIFEIIKKFNDVEIIGNIYENPNLLNK